MTVRETMSEKRSSATVALAATSLAIVAATIAYGVVVARRNNTDKEPEEARVVALHVYPIKSCGPMTVETAEVTDTGFSYDRFAQVSDGDGKYLTPRDRGNAKLFHVRPSIVRDGSSVHLDLNLACTNNNNTSGEESSSSPPPFRIEHLTDAIANSTTTEATPMIGPPVQLRDLGDGVAEWLSGATGIRDCRLTATGREYHRLVEANPDQGEPVPEDGVAPVVVSLADEAPFLLTTISSLDDLNSRMAARGKPGVDMQRFRPNIVVAGTLPWAEDSWKRIRIGGVEFHVWQRCGRCAMTTIDRETLARGPEPLATLSTFRERAGGQRNFGVHMIPVVAAASSSSPWVENGQTIEVLEYDEERLEEWKRLHAPGL